MFLNLIIFSKNYKSLIIFFNFYKNFCKNNFYCFDVLFFKYFQKKKHTFFSLLKSPHVNKKSQNQFQYYLFSKKIKLNYFQLLKVLILLKKIKKKLFSNIKIQINFFFNKTKFIKKKPHIINPDNFIIKIFKNTYKLKKKSQKINYLKIFDIFGEFYI